MDSILRQRSRALTTVSLEGGRRSTVKRKDVTHTEKWKDDPESMGVSCAKLFYVVCHSVFLFTLYLSIAWQFLVFLPLSIDAQREAYFWIMALSLVGFAFFVAPPSEDRPGHMQPSIQEFVFFLGLNGVAYVQLILGRGSAERNLVNFTSNALIVMAFCVVLHDYSIGNIFFLCEKTRTLAVCLTAFFCTFLRWDTISKLFPNVDFKTTEQTRAVFSISTITALIFLCICGLLLATFVIRDFITQMGIRRGGSRVGKILAGRIFFVAFFFFIGAILPNYDAHFHHFCMGLVLSSIPRLGTVSHCILSGLGFGLFVEGLGFWGWEPNFD